MNIFKNRPLATCCSVFLFVYFLSFYLSTFVKLSIIIVASVIGIAFLRRRLLISAICAFIVIASVLGYFYYDIHTTRAAEYSGSEISEFKIIDISFRNDSIAFVDGINEDRHRLHYTIYDPPEIKIGDVVRGETEYINIQQSDDFDVVRYYHSKDIWKEGEVRSPSITGHKSNVIYTAVSVVHNYCNDKFEQYTNEQTSNILSALSIGDRSGLDESIKRDYQRAGLSHMLAISGMHLSIIMGCIVMFADIFRVNRRWSSVVIILICVCYIFITGASSSILRAGLMFIFMSLGSLFRRASDSLTNLMTSVTLIILFSPSSVFDTGLILSFTATLGIVVVVGKYMRRDNNNKHNVKSVVGKLYTYVFISILTTISAHAFSFIPMLTLFDSFSTVSILSNLLVSPILTLILFGIPLFLLVSEFTYIAVGIGYMLDVITDIMVRVVGKISSIQNALVDLNAPFVAYTYIAIAVGILLIFVFRKRNAYLLPYLCWFMTFITLFSVCNLNLIAKCDVVMYSEASSDAIFMKNYKGYVYIDLGKGSNASENRAFTLMEDELNATELDYWIITDYSNNIIRSIYGHMNEFLIRNIYTPYPCDSFDEAASTELKYLADKENVKITFYDYGESFSVNDIDICIYDPIRFDDSSVYIPFADIEYGTRRISYIGCGYFDFVDPSEKYDILFVGDFGTKRKQRSSPIVSCTEAYVAENNAVASNNVNNIRFNFTDDSNRVKIRITK